MSFSLEGRVAVVFGVANKRSIAWSIAQGLHQAGAKLAITYQNERLEQGKDISGAEGWPTAALGSVLGSWFLAIKG
jgi:enoyl-[acyl-carrier protein] reductase I